MKFQAVVVAVLSLYFHQGEAIKCYVCNSVTDPKCSDPIDSSLATTECTPDIFKQGADLLKGYADQVTGVFQKLGIDVTTPTLEANALFNCAKLVKQDGDKKAVVRTCTVPKSDKYSFCDVAKASGGIVTFCDMCDGDACNAASGVAPSTVVMIAATVAVLLGLVANQ